jgi:hypothetical protein
MPTHIIKNLASIREHLAPEDIEAINEGARMHRRFSNIDFTILSSKDKTLIVHVRQGESDAENYLDQRTLITRTKELFGKFLPGWKIKVQAAPFKENPVKGVDHIWLAKKMLDTHTRTKDIEADTGISKANISAWVNNLKPMSQIVQAMFYFYFMCKTSKDGNSNRK